MKKERINNIIENMENFIEEYDEGNFKSFNYTDILIITYYIRYLEKIIECYESILKEK